MILRFPTRMGWAPGAEAARDDAVLAAQQEAERAQMLAHEPAAATAASQSGAPMVAAAGVPLGVPGAPAGLVFMLAVAAAAWFLVRRKPQ